MNIIMAVSSWIIFSKELATRAKNSSSDEEFRPVDCVTIILTVITVCYSFIQIANPPISINQIIKLIVWFCLFLCFIFQSEKFYRILIFRLKNIMW